MVKSPKARFFASPDTFRAWLEQHHGDARELWVGFYKTRSGRPSITWPQSVDQALCFGWIDGLRKTIDDARYMIRFTPRRPRSTWSAVNIARVAELTRLGLMSPAGVRAFEKRTSDRSAIYAYEQRRSGAFDPAQTRRFRANPKAWAHFSAEAPWYRRVATYWVISAKKEDTRDRRLAGLIAASAAGTRIGLLGRPDLPAGEGVTRSVSRGTPKKRRSRANR